MRFPQNLLLVSAVVVSLASSLSLAPATHPAAKKPRKRLGLLRKRWVWKEASEESKTEWGIVLKRFKSADMHLTDMERHFDDVMSGQYDNLHAGYDMLLTKLHKHFDKFGSSLEGASADQHTDDTTFGQMETDPKLNQTQKHALLEQHNEEQNGSFALGELGKTVTDNAEKLLKVVEKTEPSSGSVKPSAKPRGNTTGADGGSSARQQIYAKFQESAAAFHKNMAAFEAKQRAEVAKLLSVKSTLLRGLGEAANSKQPGHYLTTPSFHAHTRAADDRLSSFAKEAPTKEGACQQCKEATEGVDINGECECWVTETACKFESEGNRADEDCTLAPRWKWACGSAPWGLRGNGARKGSPSYEKC